MLNKPDRKYLFILIILLLLAELVINPIGEFPLNDDWAYSKVIATYINTGTFKVCDWQAIPFIPQFISGIAFTKLFEFSFTILRIISIVSLFAIIFVFDAIMKEFGIKPLVRFVLLLCTAFNPLALSLANTFMPDIFTLLLALAAFLFMIKFFKQSNKSNLILFILFSLLACLNRQASLVLPIAFGIIYPIYFKRDLKHSIIAFSPAVLSIIGLVLYECIATKLKELPLNYHLQSGHIIQAVTHPDLILAKSFIYYFITSTILLGLFILPLTLSNIKYHYQQIKTSLWAKATCIVYLGLIIFKVIFSGYILPFVGNMFYQMGIGPIILSGFSTQELHPNSLLAHLFWIPLNFVGGLSFFAVIVSILSKISASQNKESYFIMPLFILILLLYLIPICLSYANDRYLLFLLPFCLFAYILSFDFRINKILTTVALTFAICFSVATTHDYLSINRARWLAANHLIKDLHVSTKNIDGGFEFNGFYSTDFKNYIPSQTGRWWWIEDDTYIITPVLVGGAYKPESEYEFSSFISFRPFKYTKIYVLKRM